MAFLCVVHSSVETFLSFPSCVRACRFSSAATHSREFMHALYACLNFSPLQLGIHTYIHMSVLHHRKTLQLQIYMHTRTYIHTHIHTYICQCCTCTIPRSCSSKNCVTQAKCIHAHVHTHSHTHVHTHIHKHVHTHIHTHVHTHSYVHIYIHTYIHVSVLHHHKTLQLQNLRYASEKAIKTRYVCQNIYVHDCVYE
jgi:hypothetical protein